MFYFINHTPNLGCIFKLFNFVYSSQTQRLDNQFMFSRPVYCASNLLDPDFRHFPIHAMWKISSLCSEQRLAVYHPAYLRPPSLCDCLCIVKILQGPDCSFYSVMWVGRTQRFRQHILHAGCFKYSSDSTTCD